MTPRASLSRPPLERMMKIHDELRRGALVNCTKLMRAMEVGRQSMYDTFGDKRALFLKALEVYVSENVRAISVELQAPGSPLAAIRSALVHFSERKDLSSTDGCMGINAICEFGMRDEDVTRITRRAANVQRRTLIDTLRRAQTEGELDARTDIEGLADFFESTQWTDALVNSIVIALGTTVISTTAGILAAWAFERYQIPFRTFWYMLIMMPLFRQAATSA